MRKSFVRVLALATILFCSLPISAINVSANNDASSASSYEKEYEAAKLTFPGFRVESLQEFIRIKEYRRRLIDEAVTLHGFKTRNGEDCRCVDVYSQKALEAAGISPEELVFEPIVPPSANFRDTGEMDNKSKEMRVNAKSAEGIILDGSLDENGNRRRCPPYSFPKLIPRIEDVCRFKNLEDFFRKKPPQPRIGVAESRSDNTRRQPRIHSSSNSSEGHKYAVASDPVANIGHGADLNLWCPVVENVFEFSLSQLWCVRGSGSDRETVEAGWQVYPNKRGDHLARLFIFYTTCNYEQIGDYLGCYDLDCEGFVQTNSEIMIGGAWADYSTIGGTQYYVTFEFYRDPPTGNWWLRLGGDTWVGFYPNELFDAQGLADFSEEVELGGEIVDDQIGEATTTDMGSGRFSDEGFQFSAFVRDIHYWDLSGDFQYASGLNGFATHPTLYDIELHYSADQDWGYHFYFGGPGSYGPCAATPSASTLGASRVYGASDLGRHLAYFLLPLGAVIAISILRRKK